MRKLDEQALIARCKVLLAAGCYDLKYDIDKDELFPPGIPFDVAPLLFEKFTPAGWHVHPAEVSTVFLNRNIDSNLCEPWGNK